MPNNGDVEESGPAEFGEAIFMGKPEDRVETPACPFIVLEGSLVALGANFFTDEVIQPKEENAHPSKPKRNALSHVGLELS